MTINLLANLAPTIASQNGTAPVKPGDQGFADALNKAKPLRIAEGSKLEAAAGSIEQALEKQFEAEVFPVDEFGLGLPVIQDQISVVPQHHREIVAQAAPKTDTGGLVPNIAQAPAVETSGASDVPTDLIERTPLASSIIASIHMGRMMERSATPPSADKSSEVRAASTQPLTQASLGFSILNPDQPVADPIQDKMAKSDVKPFAESHLAQVGKEDIAPEKQATSTAPLPNARDAQAPNVVELKSTEASFKFETNPSVTHSAGVNPAPNASGTQHLAAQTAIIQTPVTNPQWGQALSQQLMNFTMKGDQNIEIQLNPLDLGPMTVSLKMNELQATAHFSSHSSLVRQALEQAIPQLRETMSEQGIQLGEASVSDQRQQQFAGGERKAPQAALTKTESEQPELLAEEKVLGKLPQDSQISTYA